MTKHEISLLIEELYDKIQFLKEDEKMSSSERKQLIEDIIGEFVFENSGKVENMNDKQLGEFVKEVLDRIKKQKDSIKHNNEDWR